MEDGKRGTLEENIESRGEPLLPADVSWRLNLQEFPALPERRDEHGSIILRRFRRTTGQPSSQILMYICIIFFILFSKVILLFCFLLFLVSFIMARPYFNIEWKFCFFFFSYQDSRPRCNFVQRCYFCFQNFLSQAAYVYTYTCVYYIFDIMLKTVFAFLFLF